MLCCLDEGSMLTSENRMLFMFTVPSYAQFKAKSVVVKSLAIERSQANNVYDLDNQLIYDLATFDINAENAVLISTKERYNSYVNWLITNKKPLNLRLSKTILPTKSLRSQLVMLMRRFHPWKEDLDKFVLRIEECGFLEAWGTQPLLGDVDDNPNLHEYRNMETRELSTDMFIPFYIFLSTGLLIAITIFAAENLIVACNKKCTSVTNYKHSKLKKHSNFFFGISLCTIPLIFFGYYYFKEDYKFPAVVGK